MTLLMLMSRTVCLCRKSPDMDPQSHIFLIGHYYQVCFVVFLCVFLTHTSWQTSPNFGSSICSHIPSGRCMLILLSSWACHSSFLCIQASAQRSQLSASSAVLTLSATLYNAHLSLFLIISLSFTISDAYNSSASSVILPSAHTTLDSQPAAATYLPRPPACHLPSSILSPPSFDTRVIKQ